MPALYNCKVNGDHYRISKFDNDFNVEASYLLTETECECPAGHRPSCRHRQMLPKFIQRDAIGSNWFLDFDRGGWVQGWKEESEIITPQQLLDDPHEFGQNARIIESAPLEEPELTAEDLTRGLEDIVPVTSSLASAALPLQQEPKLSTFDIISLAHDEAIVQQEIADGQDLLDSLAPAGLGQASEQVPSPLSPTVTTTDFDSVDSGSIPLVATTGPSPSPTIRRRV